MATVTINGTEYTVEVLSSDVSGVFTDIGELDDSTEVCLINPYDDGNSTIVCTVEQLKAYIAGDVYKTLNSVKTSAESSVAEAVSKCETATENANTAADAANLAAQTAAISEYYYGVTFDVTVSSTAVTRCGNSDLHASLPIHSRMKGCTLDDNGEVVDYLDPSTWLGNIRDGSRGQVMVELPNFYWMFKTSGTTLQVMFSEYAIPGFHEVPKRYVSAYEATVDRTNLMLASVVNTDAQYRGGNNASTYDDTERTLLGMPASYLSRTSFRTYARNRGAVGLNNCGWNCMIYDIQKELYWLFVVEFATRNTQAAYNAELTSDGYKQGGLGNGVTTLSGTYWNYFNAYYPFVPCGTTDELGNGTGEVTFTMPFMYDVCRSVGAAYATAISSYTGEYDSETAYTTGQYFTSGDSLYKVTADAGAGIDVTNTSYFTEITRTTVSVPRYRGIENIFGHIWQWTDGINVMITPADGDAISYVYTCSDPSMFSDSSYDGYTHVGNEARTEGYVTKLIFGEYGEIMPTTVGGSSTTYYCDYHYTNIPTTTTLRGVYFGGFAINTTYAGLVYAYSHYAPSLATANIGSRLCFLPSA